MILAIDIGNSNIVIAIHKDNVWTNTFRYETKETQPEFYYDNALRNILLEWGISASEVKRSVISSVVPDLNDVISLAVLNVTGVEPLVITPEVMKHLDMQVPHPYEIGSDIAANAYAALKLYGRHCIIVDFGTAITFTIAHMTNGITGVTIAPGIKTAIHSLAAHTAQLPVVPVELPESVIGHDTVSAIQAGVMWGYVGLVKELISKIKTTLNNDYKVIATGGLANILHPLETTFDHVNKDLTLDGIRMIYDYHTFVNTI
jgi:type III pantothenate kinase